MKKIILSIGLFLLTVTAFTQTIKENGTIYMNHPYIDVVKSAMQDYLAKNDSVTLKLYSDTALFWASAMKKPIKIVAAVKMWDGDFVYYDSVKVLQVGYPDYLHYIDMDAKMVQSWWTWSGKSKKTGTWYTVDFVQFDSFNKDGKIDYEAMYGDFSQLGTN